MLGIGNRISWSRHLSPRTSTNLRRLESTEGRPQRSWVPQGTAQDRRWRRHPPGGKEGSEGRCRPRDIGVLGICESSRVRGSRGSRDRAMGRTRAARTPTPTQTSARAARRPRPAARRRSVRTVPPAAQGVPPLLCAGRTSLAAGTKSCSDWSLCLLPFQVHRLVWSMSTSQSLAHAVCAESQVLNHSVQI